VHWPDVPGFKQVFDGMKAALGITEGRNPLRAGAP
jgi:hypothetical protein